MLLLTFFSGHINVDDLEDTFSVWDEPPLGSGVEVLEELDVSVVAWELLESSTLPDTVSIGTEEELLESEVLDGSSKTGEVVNLGVSVTVLVEEVGLSLELSVLDVGISEFHESVAALHVDSDGSWKSGA